MALPSVSLAAVLVGQIQPLGPEGLPSAIRKLPMTGPVAISLQGLAGDAQADRRNHGGADKAVHHYPQEHYAAWRNDLPHLADLFATGGFGENLATTGLTEENVCIGDLFRVGHALLQVSQGRSPCRKLNARFGLDDMTARVLANGRTGWYYRVLSPGECRAGDAISLEQRPCPEWSIARVHQVLTGTHLDRGALALLAGLPQLAPGWRDKAARRLVAPAAQ